MKIINKSILKLILLIVVVLPSCKKYLDAKSDKTLVVPLAVADLQGLLDNYSYMNTVGSQAGEDASDNYYLPDVKFLALPYDRSRHSYLWQPGIFTGASPTDWQKLYNVIYQANVVLDYLPNITKSSANAMDWDNCMGQALCFRAKSFYEIAQIWAKAYDSSTSTADLGIPLRLTSDFNTASTRANLKDTYNQIISDLKLAVALLPNTPIFVYRPSKPAAYALLARTYLVMRNYYNAGLYADSCLQIKSDLVDFNNLSTTTTYPFSTIQFSNPEDIIHSSSIGAANPNLSPKYGRVDTALYNLYDSNDLRKFLFFKANPDGSHYFTGSYDGRQAALAYDGVATDEVYLIRAECNARQGKVGESIGDLNALLLKRWKTGTFVPFAAATSSDALNQILTERRKELAFRMIRFSDIKRLNKEGANIIMTRLIQGVQYILPPNDSRYALPIPDNVIQFSGINQN